MVNDLERAIALVGDESAVNYRMCLKTIRKGVGQTRLDGPFLGTSTLTDVDLGTLRVLADALSLIVTEEQIEQSELEELDKSLESLTSQVGNADIRSELKAAILNSIWKLRQAINHYQWVGAEGVRTSAARAIGELAFWRKEMPKQEQAPWVKTYYETLSRVLNTAQAAALGREVGKFAIEFVQLLLKP